MKYYYSDKSFPGIPRSYVGLVGRATYDYKTRYLADFSIGYNGSENLRKAVVLVSSLPDPSDG